MTLRELFVVLDKDTSIVLTPDATVIDNNTKWYRNTSKVPQEELDRSVQEVTIETLEDETTMFWIHVGNHTGK